MRATTVGDHDTQRRFWLHNHYIVFPEVYRWYGGTVQHGVDARVDEVAHMSTTGQRGLRNKVVYLCRGLRYVKYWGRFGAI